MNKPYVKKLGKLKGFTICSIDGEWVRNHLDDAFFAGGHPLYYDFIPDKEIWIESTIAKKEIIFIVLHELMENKLMCSGLNYDVAHDLANIIEAAARKHHTKVNEILSLI